VNGAVRDAVAQAGGSLVTVVAVREPMDLGGLARAAAGTRYAALANAAAPSPAPGATPPGSTPGTENGTRLLERFGALMGRQLVSGGQAVGRELISRARGQLLSAFDGVLGRLEGLVIVRAEPSGMSPEAEQAAAAFESGLVRGVTAAGVTTVGAELTSTEPSQVPWYQSRGLSSVDDIDATAGRAALVYALNGSHGAYGIKPTANSLLPSAVSALSHP
jgi:Copper transport outer membrane protein, MctB